MVPLSLLFGVASGSMYAYLFINNDRGWLKAGFFIGGNGGIIYSYCQLLKFLDVPKQDHLNCVVFFLMTLLISMFWLVFFLARKIIKDSEEKQFKITVVDIITGNKKVFSDHYAYRKGQIDNDLNIGHLEKQKKELEIKEKSLGVKEVLLRENENRIQSALSDGVWLGLPVSAKYAVDNRFINELPEFLKHIAKFAQGLTDITAEFIDKLPQQRKGNSDRLLVKTYCTMISAYFVNAFFGGMDARVHFRFLNGRKYEKLCIWMDDGDISDQALTPIPSDKGMVHQAGISRRSLVKSLNIDFHFKSENDLKWEDYLTIVFPEEPFIKNGKPQLSMGVSVRYAHRYSTLLCFLSFVRIEEIILEKMIEVDKKIRIMEVLNG